MSLLAGFEKLNKPDILTIAAGHGMTTAGSVKTLRQKVVLHVTKGHCNKLSSSITNCEAVSLESPVPKHGHWKVSLVFANPQDARVEQPRLEILGFGYKGTAWSSHRRWTKLHELGCEVICGGQPCTLPQISDGPAKLTDTLDAVQQTVLPPG